MSVIHQTILGLKDFVHTLEVESNNIIVLTQARFLKKYQLQDNNKQFKEQYKTKFEHSLNDVKIIQNGYVISCKDMPIRVYKDDQINCVASIPDHKPNSELFLSPIRMDKSNNLIFGGGRKFLKIYDIEKLKSQQFKQFDKTMVSEVKCILSSNLLLIGDYSGNLHIVDRLSMKQISSIRGIHLDGIMDIKTLPNREDYFISSARKDNFKYMWDTRNLSSFIQCYHSQTNTNQRTDIEIDKQLRVGTQKGNLISFDIETGQIISQIHLGKRSLNCIKIVEEQIMIVTEGQRCFEQQQQQFKIMLLNRYD